MYGDDMQVEGRLLSEEEQQEARDNMSDLSEQKIFFTNEEKVIVNNLKINMASQVLIFLNFLFAATATDWAHIRVETTAGEPKEGDPIMV